MFIYQSQIDAKTEISFSAEEQKFASEVAVGTFGPSQKRIIDRNTRQLQGIYSYAISAKKYDFAERLLTLAESREKNKVDLHFCYNCWIELLYKQRDKQGYLERCIDYCIKDIKLWKKIEKDKFFANYVTTIPSFQRLAIIYEKGGKYKEAIEVSKLALSYQTVANHDGFSKRIERLSKKLEGEK